ncbi:hypothetical protein P7C70_g2832, partial [Phenoliferia sp. Uapishka_3]
MSDPDRSETLRLALVSSLPNKSSLLSVLTKPKNTGPTPTSLAPFISSLLSLLLAAPLPTIDYVAYLVKFIKSKTQDCFRNEGDKAGRWKKGKESMGPKWEGAMEGILVTLKVWLRGTDPEPSQASPEDKSYLGIHLFALLGSLLSISLLRLMLKRRYPQVLDVFEYSTTHCSENHDRISQNYVVGPVVLSKILFDSSDHQYTARTLEVAFRIGNHVSKKKNKSEPGQPTLIQQWAEHMFPTSLWCKGGGKKEKELRTKLVKKFLGMTPVTYEDEAVDFLNHLSTISLSSFQLFPALTLSANSVSYTYCDSPLLSTTNNITFGHPIAFGADSFTAVVTGPSSTPNSNETTSNGQDEEEQNTEQILEVEYSLVDHVTLERKGERLEVRMSLLGKPTLDSAELDGKSNNAEDDEIVFEVAVGNQARVEAVLGARKLIYTITETKGLPPTPATASKKHQSLSPLSSLSSHSSHNSPQFTLTKPETKSRSSVAPPPQSKPKPPAKAIPAAKPKPVAAAKPPPPIKAVAPKPKPKPLTSKSVNVAKLAGLTSRSGSGSSSPKLASAKKPAANLVKKNPPQSKVPVSVPRRTGAGRMELEEMFGTMKVGAQPEKSRPRPTAKPQSTKAPQPAPTVAKRFRASEAQDPVEVVEKRQKMDEVVEEEEVTEAAEMVEEEATAMDDVVEEEVRPAVAASSQKKKKGKVAFRVQESSPIRNPHRNAILVPNSDDVQRLADDNLSFPSPSPIEHNPFEENTDAAMMVDDPGVETDDHPLPGNDVDDEDEDMDDVLRDWESKLAGMSKSDKKRFELLAKKMMVEDDGSADGEERDDMEVEMEVVPAVEPIVAPQPPAAKPVVLPAPVPPRAKVAPAPFSSQNRKERKLPPMAQASAQLARLSPKQRSEKYSDPEDAALASVLRELSDVVFRQFASRKASSKASFGESRLAIDTMARKAMKGFSTESADLIERAGIALDWTDARKDVGTQVDAWRARVAASRKKRS